ncbi:DUF1269 domain-containing protein [Pseudaminobacter sp. 19-2017]|uniref:DUF1269 domain-containing protein n=1 Tax=Pseudaminobacter soli (ex Zhang et al. 2022) TaxID=2831468 RepID=A0A942I2A4_9HYPH|nr:DUF1269 domain-containing protein [Pseudaminobacter soli]MBS3649337.1 DUF1269 domain-containing protein [Pseudaminobacter soli]
MSTFIVVVFPDEASAQRGIRALKDLNSDSSLVLHGAAIVTKNAKGKLSMHVASDDALGTVAAGTLVGGLAGLGVGLLAAAILAAGGAVFGASAALTNRSADRKIMEDVSRHLRTDASALVADVDADDMAGLESRMNALGGTVHIQDQPPG